MPQAAEKAGASGHDRMDSGSSILGLATLAQGARTTLRFCLATWRPKVGEAGHAASSDAAAANNNDFLGDVNITESFDTYPGLVQGVSIQQVRVMTMMGLGLRLKEFVLTAKPGTRVPADSFMLGQLSDSILAIATHPKITNERGESRLFIVEPKL